MVTQYKTVAFVSRLTSDGEMIPTESSKKLNEECEGWQPILQSQSITSHDNYLIVVITFMKPEIEILEKSNAVNT